MNIEVGQKAPQITLQDQTGTKHSLSQYKGSWVVVYFYPKDDTPGCTIQACDIRDGWQAFKDKKIVVLGISPDTVESHQKFAQKHSLPFILLADPEKEALKVYGAWREKVLFGKTFLGVVRSTVLINPKGVIAKVYKRAHAKTHAKKVLKDLERLMLADSLTT